MNHYIQTQQFAHLCWKSLQCEMSPISVPKLSWIPTIRIYQNFIWFLVKVNWTPSGINETQRTTHRAHFNTVITYGSESYHFITT